MKICVLTPRFPFPENGGDVLRINSIARYLKSAGHSLSLVSFVESNTNDIANAEQLYGKVYTMKRNPWVSLMNSFLFFIMGKPIQCGYYYSSAFKSKLKAAILFEQPDVIICHLLRTSIYCEDLGLENKTIVEMTDALSKTYQIAQNSSTFSLKKIIYKFEVARIKKYEQAVINKFPKVVLVSQQDIDYLNSLRNRTSNNLCLHTNGVEVIQCKNDNYDYNKICFIGNMRTLQNQDAVLHFVKDIFPIITRQIPNAKFYVIGDQPTPKIKGLACDNIVVTGFVENLYDTVSDSCVAVAPVQIAAGIQNKVLVAIGCGIPVVMTSLISKAIPELSDGQNCYISDSNEQFAERCIEIMKNPDRRKSLSENGFKMIQEHYSWSHKLKGYEWFPNEICKEPESFSI